MTLEKAFEDLLKNWESLPADYREKYKSYRAKHLKKMPPKERIEKRYYVGAEKKKEMLLAAGYTVKPEVWKQPKKSR